MLQIIFLNIGLCVILLAIAFVFKKYARVILWSSAITLFVGTLLLVGLGIVNPVSDNETGSSEFWGTIMFLISAAALVIGAEILREKNIMNVEEVVSVDAEIILSETLDTELARKVFAKAIEAGYMKEDGTHYKWNESKVLLAYMCGRIYCGDKPMKNHTLLQAICRTNRTYNENKKCGLIVDFVGVFEDVAKSLAFDEETVKTIVQNIDEIKSLIPTFMQQCIEFFPGVDRTIGGWEGLTAAQQCLKDDGVKTNFGRHFARLNKAWEIVSPDACLAEFQNDYTWLAQVYQSVRPVSGGNLIWTLLGAKTIEIIHRNIETIDIGTPLEDLVVDADVIDAVLEDEKAREKKIVEVEKMLRLRLGEHKGDPNFKKFAEKLDELRERMEQNLISSIDFLKQLLALAKDLLEEEKKKDESQDKRAKARAALTDLFQSIKTEETPIIVEQVVNDIDNEVVNIVRQFNDAFQSVTARREIKKKLRAILWVKYQIKDNDVFERAYQYIEMYY